MAFNGMNGTELLGTQLQSLLMADGIVPGTQPSYELAKTIYLYHPSGQKIVDFPIQMAQHKGRKITVPTAPDDGKMLIEAFEAEGRAINQDGLAMNVARLARIYGVATIGILVKDDERKDPVNFSDLDKAIISFNVWDPLNTAGSLVLNQDPNAMDFLKVHGVSVNGQTYHRSRVCVLQHEAPIYINYEASGFGFLGRSIYQRGLVPLKSFILTLATDAMIALKAGVLVTKMQSQSSAVDGPMSWLFGQKREMVKEAQTGNVLSIGVEEDIESLDLQNLDGPYALARKNIIENIALACGTPAKILLAESFAEGFGEGEYDAKAIAEFVDGIRKWMDPVYGFLDQIVMYRAWNKDFYETVKARYPDEYGNVSYTAAFQSWKNSFNASWPNLLDEPDSEKAKIEDVTLKALIAVVEVLMPALPQSEKASVIEWMCDNLNSKKLLFESPMELDIDAIRNYEPPAPMEMEKPPAPESARDSAPRRHKGERFDALDADVRRQAETALRLVKGQSAADGAAV